MVIPSRNEGSQLLDTVTSILDEAANRDLDIVVVDDGSTDGSTEILRGADSRVRVLRTPGLGVAPARNFGARDAQGDFLIFLDAHCSVSQGWLDRFTAALAPLDVAVAGPAFTRLQDDSLRGCGMTWMNEHLETAWFLPVETDRAYEVPLTPGGCLAFRADMFHYLGGFDDGFESWGFEDVEICMRSWLLGYRVVVDPNIIIAHDFRERRNFDVPESAVIHNFLRLLYLHFGTKRINRIVRRIAQYPGLESAREILEASDVFQRRAELKAARTFNDDWFLQTFMPHLTGLASG